MKDRFTDGHPGPLRRRPRGEPEGFGRRLVAIPLFILLPHWLGFFGMYLVGPCADLPFAAVGLVLMVRELGKLPVSMAAAKPAAVLGAS